jgi:hypothetical protein
MSGTQRWPLEMHRALGPAGRVIMFLLSFESGQKTRTEREHFARRFGIHVYAPVTNAPVSGANHDIVYLSGANQYGENDSSLDDRTAGRCWCRRTAAQRSPI